MLTGGGGGGGLSLKTVCGEKVCPEYSVCLEHDLQCYPCASYCNETSNNFDVEICERHCQDFIHDYVRHYVKEKYIQDALQELDSLKTLIVCMTMLVAVALVFISVTLAFIWGRERRIRKIKNAGQDSFFKKKLASLQYLKKKDKVVNTVSETIANKTPANTATQTDSMMAAASSASSASSSCQPRTNTSAVSHASSSSSSGSSNKLPCEDATLKFTGYDNFGLKVSPVLGKTTTGADLLLQHQLYSP